MIRDWGLAVGRRWSLSCSYNGLLFSCSILCHKHFAKLISIQTNKVSRPTRRNHQSDEQAPLESPAFVDRFS